ncbi:CDP-alcohol phosphatidyltransferase [Spirochaetia bacterium]|nr:CDP-alcohol phosphatidyltransferase [Spirochaetia bacterium]
MLSNLTKSLTKILFVYGLFQSLVFFVLHKLWLFPLGFLFLFFVVQLTFYLAVFFFLYLNQKLFYNAFTGERETSVNDANKITLFRITMAPFLVFLTLVSQKNGFSGNPETAEPALTIAFVLTFASDFFDGFLARKRNQVTYIGRILDSACDYLLLGVTAAAFFYFKLLKPWLFLVITGRLVLNALVMLILFLVRRKLIPQTTPIGKIAIAAIMVLLVIEAAAPLGLPRWIHYAEPAAAILIGISVIDKLLFLAKNIRAAKAE